MEEKLNKKIEVSVTIITQSNSLDLALVRSLTKQMSKVDVQTSFTKEEIDAFVKKMNDEQHIDLAKYYEDQEPFDYSKDIPADYNPMKPFEWVNAQKYFYYGQV
jgi:hypothetical protein